MIVAGVATWAAGYLSGVLVARLVPTRPVGYEFGGTDWLYVPFIGPFVALTQTSSGFARFLIVTDGIAQATGAALLVVGLSTSRTVLVRDKIDQPRVLPSPIFFGSNGGGFGMVGTF